AITLQAADLDIQGLVEAAGAGGGIVIRSSAPNRAMSIGGADNAVSGINLTDSELAQLVTTSSGTITFGDTGQIGDITFTTALPATTAGSGIVVLQSTSGPGQIILDNNPSGGPGVALAASGTISLTAGTGGIVEAFGPRSSLPDIATSGTSVTIDTAAPVGSPTNPIGFANESAAQQVISIGTTTETSLPVFLNGLGMLTLGTINLAGADFQVDAPAINVKSSLQTNGGSLTFLNSASAPTPSAVRLLGGNLTISTGRPVGDSGNIDLSD